MIRPSDVCVIHFNHMQENYIVVLSSHLLKGKVNTFNDLYTQRIRQIKNLYMYMYIDFAFKTQFSKLYCSMLQ